MPTLRAYRLVRAIERGLLTASALDAVMMQPGRIADLASVVERRGWVKYLTDNETRLANLVSAGAALTVGLTTPLLRERLLPAVSIASLALTKIAQSDSSCVAWLDDAEAVTAWQEAITTSPTLLPDLSQRANAVLQSFAAKTALWANVRSNTSFDANSKNWIIGTCGLDRANYATLTALVASASAMETVAASATAMEALCASNQALTAAFASASASAILAESNTALTEITGTAAVRAALAASSTAMTAMAASTNAMAALIASSPTLSALVASSAAMNAIAASSTAMTAMAASSAACTAIAGSSIATAAVAASATAMTAIAASSTAMAAMVSSSAVMTAFAASSAAMAALAPSSTAMTAMVGSSYARSALVASSTAMTAIAASSVGSSIAIGSSNMMTAIVGSSTACTVMAASSTAMATLAASSAAMTTAKDNNTLMVGVAAWPAARTAIYNNDSVQAVVAGSPTALSALRGSTAYTVHNGGSQNYTSPVAITLGTGTFLALGVSTSANSVEYTITVATRKFGSARATSKIVDQATFNSAAALGTLVCPLVAPYSLQSNYPLTETVYVGLLRCDA